jgi:hypothetical protein
MSRRTRLSPAHRPALAAWRTLGLWLLEVLVLEVLVLELGVGARVARAQTVDAPVAAPLAGRWRAEPMTVRWVVGSWGEACGPRPSGGGDQGGPVTIEERGGELVFSGEGGSFTTEQCWQMHPGVTRASHSASSGSWKSTCRSAPSDPRQEVLQTTISVAGDTITLSESGQYQFVVQGQTCAATWRR